MTIEDERPRDERRIVRLQGFVRRGGEASAIEPAVFENVSDAGCCICGEYSIGETLVVTFPTVATREAQVRWAFAGRAGLRFL